MLNKVLVLSASSGAGHVRAAQALEKAFLMTGAAKEVRHVDSLDFANPVVRNIYSKGYIDMVNRAPTVLGILYDSADKPWKDEKQRLAFDRLNTLPLVKMLREYEPDLVICTHFLPAEIISYLLCKKKIKTRHAIVVTDFDMHAMWLCRHFDDYFVAIDETKEHLKRLGVSEERVTVSGIPVDPDFAINKDRQEMRAKYGLHPEFPVILLSAGGFGVGPVEELLSSLDELRHPAQVVALCGRNPELKARLEQLSSSPDRKSNVLIKPVGFTDQMDEYMAASDILLGKPGGLTTSEAIAKGLAIVVVNPIPGQEERNSDHLLEEGIAIRCNNLPTLAYKIDRLLDNPRRLASMKASALALSHADSAARIVDKLIHTEPRATTVNIHGAHQCESPLVRLIKPVRRLQAAERKKLRVRTEIVRKLFRIEAKQ